MNKSKLFAPWLQSQATAIQRESSNQQKKRKKSRYTTSVKTGHGGTLDPMATGVLTIGVGKGTKVLQSFIECTKTYDTVVIFGGQTDTYDTTGKILKRAPYSHITEEMIKNALAPFRGKIEQMPPLYSALKMNGKPLYEYAREGKELPRAIEKRSVEVKELELLEFMPGGTHEYKLPTEEAGEAEIKLAQAVWKIEKEQEGGKVEEKVQVKVEDAKKRKADDEVDLDAPAAKAAKVEGEIPKMSGALVADTTASVEAPVEAQPEEPVIGPPAARLRMTVTSGFYVRSLCHDLGDALGSKACMAELVRTRQGQFILGHNTIELSDFEAGEEVWGPKLEKVLDSWSGEYRPFAGSTAEQNVPEDPLASHELAPEVPMPALEPTPAPLAEAAAAPAAAATEEAPTPVNPEADRVAEIEATGNSA